MVKRNRRFILIFNGAGGILLIRNRGGYRQHFINPVGRGRSLGEQDNQIGDDDQSQQNLGDVIDKSDNLPLGEASGVNVHAPSPQDSNNRCIHDQRCYRTEPGRDTSDTDRRSGQIVRSSLEPLLFPARLGKGTDNADTGQILAEHERQMIQLLLINAVER
ncbi:hypothetical protein D3C73_1083920 [compost metagenome]